MLSENIVEGATPAEKTVLEQLGGVSGLVYSSLPVLVFVPVNTVFGLKSAIAASLVVALFILGWRLYRKETVQPAISGFLGVAVSAFIAYRIGSAKGFFLYGIYTSVVYAGIFLVSVLVRWPLVGVVRSFLEGKDMSWRQQSGAVRAYNLATLAWAAIFAARYLVQSKLYAEDHTGWLGVARIAMGWPLTAVALLVTVILVRRIDRALPG
ncbi:MAG: DUF3159 domain-containing protein [Mycobacteriaceae bacterium]